MDYGSCINGLVIFVHYSVRRPGLKSSTFYNNVANGFSKSEFFMMLGNMFVDLYYSYAAFDKWMHSWTGLVTLFSLSFALILISFFIPERR